MKRYLPILLLAACAPVAEGTAPTAPATRAAPSDMTVSAAEAVAALGTVCGDGTDSVLNFGQRLAAAQQAGTVPAGAAFTLVGSTCTLTFAPSGTPQDMAAALTPVARPLDASATGGVYIRPNKSIIIFTHDDPSSWTLQTYNAV